MGLRLAGNKKKTETLCLFFCVGVFNRSNPTSKEFEFFMCHLQHVAALLLLLETGHKNHLGNIRFFHLAARANCISSFFVHFLLLHVEDQINCANI